MASSALTSEQRLKLLSLAQDARSLSYSPYSKFRVGCSFLLSSGEFIQGANLENASYGGCICAERAAMCKALVEKKKDFIALAVAADIDGPCSPCGICRQFIREFCPLDMPIYMVPSSYDPSSPDDKKILSTILEALLPMSFGPDELDKPRSSS